MGGISRKRVAVDALRTYPYNRGDGIVDPKIRHIEGRVFTVACRLSGWSIEHVKSFMRNKMSIPVARFKCDMETGAMYVLLSPRWRRKALECGAVEFASALVAGTDGACPYIPKKKASGFGGRVGSHWFWSA